MEDENREEKQDEEMEEKVSDLTEDEKNWVKAKFKAEAEEDLEKENEEEDTEKSEDEEEAEKEEEVDEEKGVETEEAPEDQTDAEGEQGDNGPAAKPVTQNPATNTGEGLGTENTDDNMDSVPKQKFRKSPVGKELIALKKQVLKINKLLDSKSVRTAIKSEAAPETIREGEEEEKEPEIEKQFRYF